MVDQRRARDRIGPGRYCTFLHGSAALDFWQTRDAMTLGADGQANRYRRAVQAMGQRLAQALPRMSDRA